MIIIILSLYHSGFSKLHIDKAEYDFIPHLLSILGCSLPILNTYSPQRTFIVKRIPQSVNTVMLQQLLEADTYCIS